MTVGMKKIYFGVIGFVLLSCYAWAQAPTPTILVSPSVICSGKTATFTAKSSTLSPISYTWSVSPSTGTEKISSGFNDTAFILRFTNAGRYVIGLSWEFDVLGISTKTIAVIVTKSAESAFNASLSTYGYPNQLSLKDFSNNSNKIYWIFDNDFAAKDSASQLTKTYFSAGNFTVLQISYGNQGCNDTSSYQFTLVEQSKLSLPNAFTPNGDGVNDVYRPLAEGISSLNVKVFNRYGILVTEWSTINGFWDGHLSSGLACDPGTYFVIAEGQGFDGKSFSLKGNVTLMR